MATFTRRGDGQWHVKIRRRGYPAITKTFSIKAKAEYWARSVESEMDGGTFVSRAKAETTTLKEALQRYLNEITPFKKGARQESDRIKVWMSHDLASRYLANFAQCRFCAILRPEVSRRCRRQHDQKSHQPPPHGKE